MNTIHINGTPAPCVLLAGWSVDEKINTPAQFKGTVIDIDYNGKHIDLDLKNGYEIELYSENQKLFGGVLKTPEKSKYATGILQYSLTANDYTELAYRRLVAASVINKTVGEIIRELILPILEEDGVTIGEMYEGHVLRKANFNWIYCGAALMYLHEVTGCNWWIDYNKRLHFIPNSMLESPWILSDNVQHSNFKQTLEHEQYRNIQYLKCGQSRTSVQQGEILTPSPDGERQTYYTRFPVAQLITIEICTNGVWELVDGAAIGVEGLNERGSRKWYYSYGSKIITQDNDETPLAAEQNIRIVYAGLVRVFVKMQNMSEIEKRADIEGGSGKYEKLDAEVSIDNSFQATEFASSLIQKYGDIDDRITFETEKPGLAAGQLLTVNKPSFNIENQKFLIESVGIQAAGTNGLQYSIKAIDGISLGGWEAYFSKMLNANKEDEILAEETVILLHENYDTSNLSATLSITISKVLFPSDTLFPADDLFPNSANTEEVLLYD